MGKRGLGLLLVSTTRHVGRSRRSSLSRTIGHASGARPRELDCRFGFADG